MHVFDAICQAFNPKPQPCKNYVIRPTNLDKEGIPWYDIVLIILVIILLNVVCYYFIRRNVLRQLDSRIEVDKNDLSGQINSVISSYFSLREMSNKHSDEDDDDDEETNNKVNNLGDVQTFIDGDEDNKNEDKENNGTKLIMNNSIPNNKENNDENNINNKKDDDEDEEEK